MQFSSKETVILEEEGNGDGTVEKVTMAVEFHVHVVDRDVEVG